jgi:nickel transport protein
MRTCLKPLLFTVVLTPLFWSPSAFAHVIRFETINQQQYEILFGHPEESQPEPFVIEKFREATAYDQNKTVIPHTTLLENERFFVNTTSIPSALTAFYDNGYWRRNPDDTYDNITQAEAEAVNFENVSQYVKYAKGLYDWNSTLAEPLGLPLEIIPLENPLTLQAGDNLPIQVLFQGTLIDDPLVEYLGATIPIDANGIALIPNGATGLQVIEASYTDPNSSLPPVSYATTFSTESVPEPLNLVGFLGVALLGIRKKVTSFYTKK